MARGISNDILVVREDLRAWRGAYARVWDYNPTHSVLTIRVMHLERENFKAKGNLHVMCGECSYVRGPMGWFNCDLELQETQADHEDARWKLVDRRAGFEATCGMVATKQNVEPVY